MPDMPMPSPCPKCGDCTPLTADGVTICAKYGYVILVKRESADPRLLTQEQLAETKKRLERFHSYTCGRKLLDHIAALEQQRAEALEVAKILPHEMGCGWTNCNCSRGLLIEKLGGKE